MPIFAPLQPSPAYRGPSPFAHVGLSEVMSMPLSYGDAGTEQTLEVMKRLVDEGKKDQLVNRTAIEIVRNVQPFDMRGQYTAIYNWVLKNIRFTPDIAGVETLRTARETLTVRAGDCDDFSTLIASLLQTIGHRARFVTVKANPANPKLFSHIYPEVWDRGRWVPLDAARKNPAIGRGPTNYFEKRTWELDGLAGAGLGYYDAGGRLGVDWGAVSDIIQQGSAAAGNIIRQIKTPAQYLPPSSGVPYYPPGGATGSVQITGASSSSWLPWAFGGGLLLALVLARR